MGHKRNGRNKHRKKQQKRNRYRRDNNIENNLVARKDRRISRQELCVALVALAMIARPL